jgi:hypothetical protein
MISSHLEFVSIYYYEITDIIIKKTRDVDAKKEGEGERQIKRKVHQEEHRQISGHATITVRIVRVCAQRLYIATFRSKSVSGID